MLRLIVAGGRNVKDFDAVCAAITDWVSHHGVPDEIVTGTAMEPEMWEDPTLTVGVDRLIQLWAAIHDVPVTVFPYRSDLGRRGGPVRNQEMADYVGKDGYLLAVWDHRSPGTRSMIEIARKDGLDVTVWPINK